MKTIVLSSKSSAGDFLPVHARRRHYQYHAPKHRIDQMFGFFGVMLAVVLLALVAVLMTASIW